VADATTGPLADAALAACDGVLARVWLTGPGDRCAVCPWRAECPDQRRCLHLVASAGLTTRLDGPFRRFPIGARQVGRVPVTREPFVATETLPELDIAERTWLAAHRVRGFAAVPIEYGDACLGVLAVFSQGTLPRRETDALRHVARLGGAALGHLRAFRDLAGERNRLAARSARRAAADRDEAPRLLKPWIETEREILERVLAHTRGRVSGPRGAAAILRLRPTTLFSRLKKLGVRRRPE
jgi:transcriptional regulator with GAF, ATPase, and Fis domain